MKKKVFEYRLYNPSNKWEEVIEELAEFLRKELSAKHLEVDIIVRKDRFVIGNRRGTAPIISINIRYSNGEVPDYALRVLMTIFEGMPIYVYIPYNDLHFTIGE